MIKLISTKVKEMLMGREMELTTQHEPGVGVVVR